MIVRFSKIDRRMNELFEELMFRYSHTFDPIFSDIETYVIHEGRRTTMRHGDNTWGNALTETSAEYSIKNEDLKNFDFAAFARFARTMGVQFLDAKKRMLFEAMHEATEMTGNVVDRRGKPLDHDAIFEMLELIQIDFDVQGQPDMPSMVIHPDMGPTIERLAKEAEESPELQKRHDQIMRRKKEEFLAREADRKLVG
jgi:hypothetical protein